MRKVKRNIVLLLPFLLLIGCSGNYGNVCTDGYPLFVSSVSLSGIQTRSTTSLATDGSTISVSTLNAGVVNGTSQYTYTSGAWEKTYDSPGLLAPEGTLLCAYYPYSADITDKSSIPLSSAKYDASKDISYAYSTAVADAAHGVSHAAFSLQHAYARLTFNFSCEGCYTGSKSIGNIIISNSGILSSSSLNITQPSGVYGSKNIGHVTFNAGITDFTSTSSASVLMVPTDVLTGDLNIQIQVGSDNKLLILPAALFANSKLEAGVNYQIAVTVKANGALVLNSKNVQIIDWVIPSSVTNSLIGIQPESNSYIIAPGGVILIPVSRATTGNAANFPAGASFTCGLLWSDVSANHVTASVADRYIKVTAGNTEGNSVVYAKNSNGDIVWSWHVWVTNYNPSLTANTNFNSTTYQSANGLLWMDRNLGAIAVADGNNNFATCGGLFYQWGRKDPFPGSNGSAIKTATPKSISVNITPTKGTQLSNDNVYYYSLSSTSDYSSALLYSIQSPLTFFGNWGGSTATEAAAASVSGGMYSWNTQIGNEKTIYDPCPVGWRIPAWINGVSPWAALPDKNLMQNDHSITAYGDFYSYSFGTYPAAGFRTEAGVIDGVGMFGESYSASEHANYAYVLVFTNSGVGAGTNNYGSRAQGIPVRCIKD